MKRTKSLNNLQAIAFLQSGAARLLQEAAQMPGKCNLFHSQIRGELITVDTKWRGGGRKIRFLIELVLSQEIFPPLGDTSEASDTYRCH